MTNHASTRESPFPAHRLAADLEAFLGDPLDSAADAFSYQAIVEAEERSALPAGAIATVQTWGFPAYLVPHHLGGSLANLEDLFLLTRTIARRNATVAVMYGSTLLAANPVWLWGDPRQQKTLANGLLSGDLACFGVSEADHGSDVKSCKTRADPVPGGLALTGSKWLVGNATRGRFVTTYARTGARDFSLVLVDKNDLDPSSWSSLPPLKTVGIRGHDLSGITFAGTRVPAASVIGRPGTGLAQTLKTLQITRIAIAALSMGTMDAVVRIAMEYAAQRVLYGEPVSRIPAIREHLVNAHLDLLIAECVAVPVARSLTVAPARLSLWSSVVKYFVPVLGDEVVRSIATVLAARGYLREGVAHGVFQKLQRDNAIFGIFEGTTHVNLAEIARQLPHVTTDRPAADGTGALQAELFTWTESPPLWVPDGRKLQLTNEGHDEIGRHYAAIAEDVLATARDHATPDVAAALTGLVSRISRLRSQLHARIQADPTDVNSAAALRRAQRHCEIHAMVSCMLTWLHNRDVLGGTFASGTWLVLCLQRLLQHADPDTELAEEYLPELESAMFAGAQHRQWFSLVSLAAPARQMVA